MRKGSQGQRVRGAAIVRLRRDNPHVVGQISGDLLKHIEASGFNAIVIGEQNTHGLQR